MRKFLVNIWEILRCIATGVIKSPLHPTKWISYIRREYSNLKIYQILCRMDKSFKEFNSPKSKLKRARKATKTLRNGYWVNQYGKKIFLSPNEYSIKSNLQDINEALEDGFSYKQIRTTREEVIGFRNGEAHKASARQQLALSRTFERSPLSYEIIALTKDAGFSLEDIGTSELELEFLEREYSRRLGFGMIDRFRQYATGVSDLWQDIDWVEKTVIKLLSDGFSYEDIGTNELEYRELVQLVRRQNIEKRIQDFRNNGRKGGLKSIVIRELITESLEKAGLTLSDFNLTESDLDEIENANSLNN